MPRTPERLRRHWGAGGYGLAAGGSGGSGGSDIYTRIRYSSGGGGGGGSAGGWFGSSGSCDPPATATTGGQGGKSRFSGAGVSAVIVRGSGRMPGSAEASDGAGMGAAGADQAEGGTDGRVVVRLCSNRGPFGAGIAPRDAQAAAADSGRN